MIEDRLSFLKRKVETYSNLRKKAFDCTENYRKLYYESKKELISIEADLDSAIAELQNFETEEMVNKCLD